MSTKLHPRDIELFRTYFNVADEMWGDGKGSGLKLDDLLASAVSDAELAAQRLGLSWPPYLPEAEEFYLDHIKELS
jgi:hypothetical protein